MPATRRNPYIGHPAQLLRINDHIVTDGLAHGIRATDIQNGPLHLTVCADKGMDFPFLRYKGVNLGYIAPCGLVGSGYYNDRGDSFLRGFFAGFLTTCGLDHIGAPCDVDGRHYGLHGRENNLPAEQYAAQLMEDEHGSRYVGSGTMRQAVLFGENLTLERKVTLGYDEAFFSFTDTVTNRGFHQQPHRILYHFNIGYPLLDESAEILLPYRSVEARDAHSQTHFSTRLELSKPLPNQRETAYFYQLNKENDGQTCVGLYNHKLQLGLMIHYNAMLLNHFTQWKMLGEGEYVLGLEPGNAIPLGFQAEQALGHVKPLEPWESRTYRFKIQIVEGEAELQAYQAKISGMRP